MALSRVADDDIIYRKWRRKFSRVIMGNGVMAANHPLIPPTSQLRPSITSVLLNVKN
jgi:hypothetical protein